jgi:hypothetical protein
MDDRHKLDSRVLRRLNDDRLKEGMNNLLESFDPCYYNDAGEYISSMCDLLKDDFIIDIDVVTNAKTRDALYFYIVDKFGSQILKFFNKRRC